MARDLHRHGFSHAGAHQIPHRRSPEVVHQTARMTGPLAGASPRVVHVLDAIAATLEDPRTDRTLGLERLMVGPGAPQELRQRGIVADVDDPGLPVFRGPCA